MKKLGELIADKLEQWERQDAVTAAIAIKKGVVGSLVRYPTGIEKVQYDNGSKQECSKEVWLTLGGEVTL